ncbi:MAG: glycoside hydrolase family 140 protein [Opitutus sp.]
MKALNTLAARLSVQSLVACLLVYLTSAAFGLAAPAQRPPAPILKISENSHFLTRSDGTPFFYLADTAWELIHRLSREDAEQYLKRRAAQGFTVIQTVVLAEMDGLNTPNTYGELPLLGRDPLKPNERYFEHVDWVVNQAESHGLYVALLPTWGDKWNKKWGVGPEIFTATNAEAYGEWLARRYSQRAIIWILGGDRPIETDGHRAIVNAMARGVRKGDGGSHLITFHPSGGSGSGQYFHGESWLDFNFRQNGHGSSFNVNYVKTREDYDRPPAKPVIDGEPIYEGHPLAFKPDDFGHSVAADVRRALYWDLFTGACGHTYGHHSIWQFFDRGREPVNRPLMTWREAMEEPGANQMQFGRRLIESRPMLTRVPDDDVIVPAVVKSSIPGAGAYRFVATRASDGSYAMVYAPVGRAFRVRMDKISGPVKAWWFNPRNGEATPAGEFPNTGEYEFTPPNRGEVLDWILVLDDATKKFPAPGVVTSQRPSA